MMLPKSSPGSISKAGAGALNQLEGDVLKANLWNQAGEGTYPIASFTYLIAYRDLNNLKSKEQAQALLDFFWWATHDGQAFARELHYAPLPSKLVEALDKKLDQVVAK